MTNTTVPTFVATIYVGLRNRTEKTIVERGLVLDKIQTYVNTVGLCVSVTDTTYCYTNGNEPGLIVGLINYPRFPSTPEQIKAHALILAELLLKTCKQMKVSVILPTETVMLSADE